MATESNLCNLKWLRNHKISFLSFYKRQDKEKLRLIKFKSSQHLLLEYFLRQEAERKMKSISEYLRRNRTDGHKERNGEEKKNTTSALQQQLKALSSYKYMFYASYFFFLLSLFHVHTGESDGRWCFTHTSLRALTTLPATISTRSRPILCSSLHRAKNVFSMWKVRVELPFWISLTSTCGNSRCSVVSGRKWLKHENFSSSSSPPPSSSLRFCFPFFPASLMLQYAEWKLCWRRWSFQYFPFRLV